MDKHAIMTKRLGRKKAKNKIVIVCKQHNFRSLFQLEHVILNVLGK